MDGCQVSDIGYRVSAVLDFVFCVLEFICSLFFAFCFLISVIGYLYQLVVSYLLIFNL